MSGVGVWSFDDIEGLTPEVRAFLEKQSPGGATEQERLDPAVFFPVADPEDAPTDAGPDLIVRVTNGPSMEVWQEPAAADHTDGVDGQ